MTPAARPVVDLLYADDCPSVGATRSALLRAFSLVGFEPLWREWRRDEPDCPQRLRGLGSPTILVGGRDVAGDSDSAAADCCRIYQHAGKISGVPDVEQIAAALRDVMQRPGVTESDMQTLHLKIEGMHCGGCAETIQTLLAREPGVRSASVSYPAAEARILYEPAATDERALIKAVEQAGYRARTENRQVPR